MAGERNKGGSTNTTLAHCVYMCSQVRVWGNEGDSMRQREGCLGQRGYISQSSATVLKSFIIWNHTSWLPEYSSHLSRRQIKRSVFRLRTKSAIIRTELQPVMITPFFSEKWKALQKMYIYCFISRSNPAVAEWLLLHRSPSCGILQWILWQPPDLQRQVSWFLEMTKTIV